MLRLLRLHGMWSSKASALAASGIAADGASKSPDEHGMHHGHSVAWSIFVFVELLTGLIHEGLLQWLTRLQLESPLQLPEKFRLYSFAG